MAPNQPRVLLADDEADIRTNLAGLLTRSGFDVVVVEDGRAALDVFEAGGVDVAVLDVVMPEVDGREVVRRLRRTGTWTPVLLLTQVGESAERAMAIEEGADDYLEQAVRSP